MISVDTATVIVIVRTLLDRSVKNIITILLLSLSRTDVTDPNGESEVVHDMERITSSLENLQIRGDNAPLQLSARERKPNARYFNNETITTF